MGKSEILNINLRKADEENLRKKFQFIWKKEIKYLGVKLANSLDKIYKGNYIPLLDEIRKEGKKIQIRPISWIGRINAIKMTLLPKITYKFQMLPIDLPIYYLRKLKTILTNVIWKNKKPRVSLKTLRKGKKNGGLAAPDIVTYYNAIILSRAIEWVRDNQEKRWVNLEKFYSKAQLGAIIWNPPQHRTIDENTHGLTRVVIKMWDRTYKQLNKTYNSPLIRVNDNEFFAPGKVSIGGKWIKKDKVELREIMKKGKIKTMHKLQQDTETWVMNGWRYAQLERFIRKLPQPIRSGEELTGLEKLCTLENTKNTISKLYKLLIDEDEIEKPSYIKQWEKDLGTLVELNTIKKIMNLTHSSAIDVKTTEMNYKCLVRWYITPERASKFQKESSAECWRGCGEIGTMAHIWWKCPKIQKYWEKVLSMVQKITGKEVKKEPWSVLFHGIKESEKQYKASLVPHLINAAKKLIPKNWREKESPQIWEWINAVEETYTMERFYGSKEEGGEGRKDKWKSWREFKKTWSYAEKIRYQ